MHLQRESAARCRQARDAASRGDYPLAAKYYDDAEQGGFALPAEEDETLLAIAEYYGEHEDYRTAIVWYGKICDTNRIDSYTLYYIGTCYRDGIDAERDEAAALYWLRLAAEREEPIALWTVGILHRDGLMGVEPDPIEAERLMTHAYRLGLDMGMSAPPAELAALYRQRYGTGWAAHALAFLAELGERPFDHRTHYELGLAYETGRYDSWAIRIEPDPASAFFHYRRAVALRTHTKAAYRLGMCYLEGIGTERDEAEAARIFKVYAGANADAANALGECYYNGRGVEPDYEKTFFYCSRAAERGHAEAQYNTGFCYEHGYGVSQDWAAARRWYEQSAAQGFALAEERLAEGFPEAGTSAETAIAPADAAKAGEGKAGEAKLLSESVGRATDALIERSPEAIARLEAAAERFAGLDPDDVNAMIAMLEQCETKEETFFLRQAINEKLTAVMEQPDPTTVRIVNDSIRIYEPGSTLIIDKEYARRHLTDMAIRYAAETDTDYLWLLPGTGYAVVYELPALLDESRNISIIAMSMMRYCRDYFEEYLLYPDKFREQYELNWNRTL